MDNDDQLAMAMSIAAAKEAWAELFEEDKKAYDNISGVTSYMKGTSALDVQIGGDHYKKLKIQPVEYSMANNLDACQYSAIKYITRFRDKGGITDLEKAKHFIDLLIEFEKNATNVR